MARVGDLLYVGPKDAAARLPYAIAETKKQIRKLPKVARGKWSQRSEILWTDATTTYEIQSWFQLTHGVTVNGEIPFDVWPQADWPKLTLAEQMSLFLVGFEKGFEVASDGNSIKLQPFPQIESASQKIKLPENKFDFESAKQALSLIHI